ALGAEAREAGARRTQREAELVGGEGGLSRQGPRGREQGGDARPVVVRGGQGAHGAPDDRRGAGGHEHEQAAAAERGEARGGRRAQGEGAGQRRGGSAEARGEGGGGGLGEAQLRDEAAAELDAPGAQLGALGDE